MAISKLEVGVVPLGVGGDSLRSAAAKINANFSDATHAASKLVGTAAGQVPLAQDSLLAGYGAGTTTVAVDFNLNDAVVGSQIYINGSYGVNRPPEGREFVIFTKHGYLKTTKIQIAYDYYTGEIYTRSSVANWGRGWIPSSTNQVTYSTTTASGANVVVDTTGKLMRSTSSERYKDILAPLDLDDTRYADAMALKPIVYRSTADADNPAYHYYSFSAEELGAYDPAFTLWRETETVTDEDGNVTEQPLAERQAEGININALLAMGHAIAIKQGELIKDLQEQVNALKLKLEV